MSKPNPIQELRAQADAFWQVRTEQERKLLRIGGIVVGLALFYGLLVDPAHGGLGAGPAVLERAMEELGAVLAPTPILSTVIATALVQGLGELFHGLQLGDAIEVHPVVAKRSGSGVRADDAAKRQAIINAGGEVLVWYYKDSLEELVKKRSDIFRRVRE